MANQKKSQDEHKAVAILSYLLIGVIWYLADKNVQNSRTKFHVMQGANLFLIALLINIVFNIIGFLIIFIHMLLQLAILVLVIIGIINAANDKQNKLPIIGDFAEKYLKDVF